MMILIALFFIAAGYVFWRNWKLGLVFVIGISLIGILMSCTVTRSPGFFS